MSESYHAWTMHKLNVLIKYFSKDGSPSAIVKCMSLINTMVLFTFNTVLVQNQAKSPSSLNLYINYFVEISCIIVRIN